MTMRFEHEFTVPVPIEQAWSVLLDVERVAPCLPGATLDTVDGDTFTGRMKVKVGPITVTYRGEASFQSVDKDAHTLSIKASGKEARGTGTAGAVVDAALAGEGGQTRVKVETSFNVTGRPAQFGRGVMAEVGAKLIDRFAANLAALLRESPEEVPAAALSEEAAPPGPVSAGAIPPEAPTEEVIPAEPLAEEAAGGPATTPFNQPEAAPHGEEEIAEVVPLGEAADKHPEPVQATRAPETTPGSEAAESTPPGQPGQPGQAGRHLTAVPDSYDALYAEEAAGREAHPAGTARTSRTAEEEALDLLEIAGVPLLKRLAPAVAGLAVVVFLAWLVRRILTRR
ncbi:SRPBCC family protein [Sphaerisporangium perillae]|uniref:SRPBCC family protein n=1 Tax=Sphaerisporangium perillae TaxID=2935860 RepID=UPI00200E8CED|nr:SRPBCC family protein [Sphaerisporangium perillae]